jgi:glycosyltransferase involved in cell wall biosynthesis
VELFNLKFLYLSMIDLNAPKCIGVYKKNLWQIRAIEQLGESALLGCFNGPDNFSVFDTEGNLIYDIPIKNSGIKRFTTLYNEIYSFIKNNDINVLYFRWGRYDPLFIKLLARVRSEVSKIYLEIPTYPYRKEQKIEHKQLWKQKNYKNLGKVLLRELLDSIGIKFLKKYVNNIVTYMEHDNIWGIPVILIDNGVSVEKITIKKQKENNNFFVISGVANISHWHGFDRVITGISEYYRSGGTEKIIFQVIGEGDALLNLKNLAKELNVEKNILFLGFKRDEELDRVLDNSDVAISSLGMHRIGLKVGSTLKTKEYCARGIPFIYSYEERALPKNVPFAMICPSDDRPINISKVIKFGIECRGNKKTSDEMRQFASTHYDWTVQMKKVISPLISKL